MQSVIGQPSALRPLVSGDVVCELGYISALASSRLAVGDLNGDGLVSSADLVELLSQWGQTGAGLSADLNGDQIVDSPDLALLLSHWG